MGQVLQKVCDYLILIILGYFTFSYFIPFPYFANPITFSPYDISSYLSFLRGYGLRPYLTPITFSFCFLTILLIKHKLKYLIVGFTFILYYFFRHSVAHALSSFFILFFIFMYFSYGKPYRIRQEMAWTTLGISLLVAGLHKLNPYFLAADSFNFSNHFFNLSQAPLKDFILTAMRIPYLPYLIAFGEILTGLLLLLKFRSAILMVALTTIFFSLFYGRIIWVLFFFTPLFLCCDKRLFVVFARLFTYRLKIKCILLTVIAGIFALRWISPMQFFFSIPLTFIILLFHPHFFSIFKKLKRNKQRIIFQKLAPWSRATLPFACLVILFYSSSFIFKLPEPMGLSMFSSKDKIHNRASLLSKDPAFCLMFQRLFNPGYAWGSYVEFLGSNVSEGCRIHTISLPTLIFLKENTCKFLVSCEATIETP